MGTGEPSGRAAIVVDVEQVAAPEVNTVIPSGIIVEPGKDVFAKDDKDKAKSAAWDDSEPKDVVSSGGDAERVVSVVGVEESVQDNTEAQAGGAREPVEVPSEPVSVGEEQTAVPAGRKQEGPLDHEEALADQVAHELYPEARDVGEQKIVHDE